MTLPWHRRPAVIVGLLVVLPPLGIALMWMRMTWTPKTKQIVSLVAAAWFVVILIAPSRDKNKSPSGTTTTSVPSPAPTPAAPSKSETPKPPPPAAGPALVEHEPLLAVPLKVDGFKLDSASHLPPNIPVGFSARYTGAAPKTQRLVASLMVTKSGVPLDPVDKTNQAMKVGTHDGVLTIEDDKDEKSFILEWVAGPWHANVMVEYKRGDDKAAAKAAIENVAKTVAAQLDLFLADTPPTEAERRQQLGEVARATSSAAISELVSKMEKAGITNDIVASVKLDDLDPNQVDVTVGETWLVANKEDRLMAAQNIWKTWASINTPTDPDTSHIKLVDANGNEVGGSGIMGSSIKVER